MRTYMYHNSAHTWWECMETEYKYGKDVQKHYSLPSGYLYQIL